MAGFVSEERLTYGPWQAIERMLARLIEHSGFKEVMLVGGSGAKAQIWSALSAIDDG